MNYVHFTFENIFDYKSVLEQIPKNDFRFDDLSSDIELLQLTVGYWHTPTPYEDFIASICNSKYTVTTTVCDLLKDTE